MSSKLSAMLLAAAMLWSAVSLGQPLPIRGFDEDSEYNSYPTQPNEVLPIQPVLLYPLQHDSLRHQGRNLDRQKEVIYVRLLKRRNGYRPMASLLDGEASEAKELSVNDIYYVKAPANGQFSTRRFQVYRIPEFYAINVFHKAAGDASGPTTTSSVDEK